MCDSDATEIYHSPNECLESEYKRDLEIQLRAKRKLIEELHQYQKIIRRLQNENYNIKQDYEREIKKTFKLNKKFEKNAQNLEENRNTNKILVIEKNLKEEKAMYQNLKIQQKVLRQENIKLSKKLKINEILNTYSIEKLEREKNEMRKNFEKTTKELENKNKILEENNIDLKNKLKDLERKVKDFENYRRKTFHYENDDKNKSIIQKNEFIKVSEELEDLKKNFEHQRKVNQLLIKEKTQLNNDLKNSRQEHLNFFDHSRKILLKNKNLETDKEFQEKEIKKLSEIIEQEREKYGLTKSVSQEMELLKNKSLEMETIIKELKEKLVKSEEKVQNINELFNNYKRETEIQIKNLEKIKNNNDLKDGKILQLEELIEKKPNQIRRYENRIENLSKNSELDKKELFEMIETERRKNQKLLEENEKLNENDIEMKDDLQGISFIANNSTEIRFVDYEKKVREFEIYKKSVGNSLDSYKEKSVHSKNQWLEVKRSLNKELTKGKRLEQEKKRLSAKLISTKYKMSETIESLRKEINKLNGKLLGLEKKIQNRVKNIKNNEEFVEKSSFKVSKNEALKSDSNEESKILKQKSKILSVKLKKLEDKEFISFQ